MNVEVERMTMIREDKLSLTVEEYNHRIKFIQKDLIPPPMASFLVDDNFKHIFKNKPVQVTPVPNAP